MEYLNVSIRGGIVALCLVMFSGCSSTPPYRADRAKVDSINTVAVVGFAVPWRVGVDKESNNPSTLPSFMRKKNQSNGEQVAPVVLAGFIEGMSKAPSMKLMSSEEVAANAQFSALAAEYDQSKKLEYNKSGAAGIPLIPLGHGTDKMEFAQKAATALGVDGVILLDFSALYYDLYTGAMGSGQAKARATALFNLFDKTGQSVWEADSLVVTEQSAGMALGVLTNNADGLQKDAGVQVAADILKVYKEQGVAKK